MIAHRQYLTASLLVLAGLVPLPSASAQTPDNLDNGTCCFTAVPVLPMFPKIETDALSICWKDCDVDQITTCQASFTPPINFATMNSPAPCGWFYTRVVLSDQFGVKWFGTLRLMYSRTWFECDCDHYQVWRLIANGDLFPQPGAGAPPCPVPPCAAQFNNRVHVTGYVDYAQQLTSGNFFFAWMLNHDCDVIDHAPGHPRSGTFHPDRSYTFVGPATGFVVDPNEPIEAGVAGVEAVRTWRVLASDIVCEFEEPLSQATINPVSSSCLCGLPGVNQYESSEFLLDGTCGTTMDGGALSAPFVSKSIGHWTNPLVYPGDEIVRWNSGIYEYQDPCGGLPPTIQYYFGVTTMGGIPASELTQAGIGNALPDIFVDQCNSVVDVNGGLVPRKNVPAFANHVINLNF